MALKPHSAVGGGVLLCWCLCRYTDEVRKVIKQCYEEVWTILLEHR
jgi:hypothetical protein